jgi:transposase
MQLLKDYIAETRETTLEVAQRFNVSRTVIYNWIEKGAFISGEEGDQKITINRQAAKERSDDDL